MTVYFPDMIQGLQLNMGGKLIVWAHTSPRTAVQGKSGLIIRIVCDK